MSFSRFNKKPSSTVGSSSSTALPVSILNWVLRFFQFVLALTVIGLYAKDLNKAHKEHKYSDGKWVYAVVVSVLSAFTALVYCFPKIKWSWGFGWDLVLFILWTALFGVFGKMYIHEDPEGDSGVKRMKNAVWVDLTNMLLWLITAVMSVVVFFTMKDGRSLHTGRAKV